MFGENPVIIANAPLEPGSYTIHIDTIGTFQQFMDFGLFIEFEKGCDADFDGDGDVDLGDFGLFGAAFGSSGTPADTRYDAVVDIDDDGDVDLGDFGVFGEEFGRTDCND